MGQGGPIEAQLGEARIAFPQASDASAFGADCLLLDGLIIACGLPLFSLLGIPSSVPLAIVYVLSIVALIALTPFLTWMLHWGRPVPLRVRRISATSLLYQSPVLIIVFIAVALEMQSMLLGISIMGFAAAVLIAVAGERFRDYPPSRALVVARAAALVLTPLVVLVLTQFLPHGNGLVSGWAIPMPVAAAGAVGAARGFAHQMALRDRLSPHQ